MEGKIISCCGVICSECQYFPVDCQGCSSIEGKPFWLTFTGESVCSIYDCCICNKELPHCGKCRELPCHRFHGQDPTKSPEENEDDQKKRLEVLKSRE